MQYTLAVLLIFAAFTPASAMDAEVFTLEVANPKVGFIAKFYPYEDMDRETCAARLKDIRVTAPAQAFCVQRVVKREFC